MSKSVVFRLGPLAVSIVIPLALGALSGFITSGSMQQFEQLLKPPLAPPGIAFPIVWTILYVLMGIASYLIWQSADRGRGKALVLYGIQLLVNVLWPILFFTLQMRLLSFFWLLLLIVLIIWTMARFAKINKTAAWLLVPYLLWTLFAGYLNLGVYLLNR